MNIKDYPVTSDDAHIALAQMETTHTVQLMQANDIDGKLIMPADYIDKLAGACAWVRFTLEKYTFRNDDNRAKDTFVADIESIRLVVKADPTPLVDTPQGSPKKRKTRKVYKTGTDPFAAHRAGKKGKGKA